MSRTQKPYRLGIIGSSGRMGQSIKRLIETTYGHDFRLTAEIDRNNGMSFLDQVHRVDLMIDVSLPNAGCHYLGELLKAEDALPPWIIGSTGWSELQLQTIKDYSRKTPIVMAPNFSPVVNLFLHILNNYAGHFKKWGYDVALSEIHHARKKDAPSGTALALAKPLEAAGLLPQTSCVRAGSIVGTHTVSFFGEQDVFEVKHEALNRDLFAKGALLAASWLGDKYYGQSLKPGLYSMEDVLFGSK